MERNKNLTLTSLQVRANQILRYRPQYGFSPCAQVRVYSSMMRHNIEAGLNAILPEHTDLQRTLLDQTMNKPDPDAENEWDTIRDMDKVSAACNQIQMLPRTLNVVTCLVALVLGVLCMDPDPGMLH